MKTKLMLKPSMILDLRDALIRSFTVTVADAKRDIETNFACSYCDGEGCVDVPHAADWVQCKHCKGTGAAYPRDPNAFIDVRLCIDGPNKWTVRLGCVDDDPYHSKICAASTIDVETDVESLADELISMAVDAAAETQTVEAQANVRLIAAGPDMLALLQDFKKQEWNPDYLERFAQAVQTVVDRIEGK